MGDLQLLQEVKKTQETLGKFIKHPPLSEKLLMRPPFRFLHDLVINVINETGYLRGVFSKDELNPKADLYTAEFKRMFLNKLIIAAMETTGESSQVKPSKILSGKEPEKTNNLLQIIAQGIQLEKNAQAKTKRPLKKSIIQDNATIRKEQSEKIIKQNAKFKPKPEDINAKLKLKKLKLEESTSFTPKKKTLPQNNLAKDLPVVKLKSKDPIDHSLEIKRIDKIGKNPSFKPNGNLMNLKKDELHPLSSVEAATEEEIEIEQSHSHEDLQENLSIKPFTNCNTNNSDRATAENTKARTLSSHMKNLERKDTTKENAEKDVSPVEISKKDFDKSRRSTRKSTKSVMRDSNPDEDRKEQRCKIITTKHESSIQEDSENWVDEDSCNHLFEKLCLGHVTEEPSEESEYSQIVTHKPTGSDVSLCKSNSHTSVSVTDDEYSNMNKVESKRKMSTNPSKESLVVVEDESVKYGNQDLIEDKVKQNLIPVSKSHETTDAIRTESRRESARKPGSAKPYSGRPPPPSRSKLFHLPILNQNDIEYRPPESKVSNLLLDSNIDEPEDDGFIVKEAAICGNSFSDDIHNIPRGILRQTNSEDSTLAQDQRSYLVAQIMTTQQELETNNKTDGVSSVAQLSNHGKEQLCKQYKEEVEKIQEFMQMAARKATPITKLLDFEDLQSIEYNRWKNESKKLEKELKEAKLEAVKSLEPWKEALNEIEEKIKEKEVEMIGTKMKILKLDDNVGKILKAMDRSNKTFENQKKIFRNERPTLPSFEQVKNLLQISPEHTDFADTGLFPGIKGLNIDTSDNLLSTSTPLDIGTTHENLKKKASDENKIGWVYSSGSGDFNY